jgi:tetratricopeptide (TPR) repeat protein
MSKDNKISLYSNKMNCYSNKIESKDNKISLYSISVVLRFILIVVFLVCAKCSFGQNKTQTDYFLAEEYFKNGKINEGIKIMEDLINKDFNDTYYQTLLNEYIAINNNKDAEKLIKKAIKKSHQQYNYMIDLGNLYLNNADTNKANKQFDKVIDNLSNNNSDIINCANYFMNKNNYDYALKTFLYGRKMQKNPTSYTYEVSYIYQIQGKNDKIAEEYILLLEQNPSYLSQIEVNINNLLSRDKDNRLLKSINSIVLNQTKKNPNNQAINELYLWTLMQDNQYSLAFNQAKAIDKRFKEDKGDIVFSFSQIALNNKQYDIAYKGFKYIIDKGKENNYYQRCRILSLSCLYLPFAEKTSHSEKEIKQMKNEYVSLLNEIGQNPSTVEIMQQYASLLAYHLQQPQEAVDILDSTINMRNVSSYLIAQSKLIRADIFLFENDVWQASLTYSQVEKDMKDETIGQQAKFSNAMLSYYIGDFQWAYSQFDVLRSSTTKLIANDAMEYSLLIKENIDEDSTYNGLRLYAKADLCLYQNKTSQAKQYLDSINQNYLTHPLFDEVLYKRAEIAMKENNYLEADSLLNELIIKYPYDITADDAVFMLAKINEENFHNNKKAIEYYQKLILDYPSSLYVNQARKKYNELNKQQN